MHSIRITTAALALALPLTAQTFVTVPSRAATNSDGNWYATYLFWGSTTNSNARAQLLYPTSDISQLAGVLDGIAFRRNAYLGGTQAAQTVNVSIDVSVSSVNFASPSTTYANNHGANQITVFNGPVNLPSATRVGWPEPWLATIPFTTNFVYVQPAGSTLVVDLTTSGPTSRWDVESSQVGYGTNAVNLYQSNCRHSGGTASGGFSYSTFQPYPGGGFSLTLSGMPTNQPTFAASRFIIGFTGAGGTWGGLPLPFLLSAVGLPAQPNCQWAQDYVIDLPMTYRTGTSGTSSGSLQAPSFTLPNDPTLTGASFFTQAICLDQDPVTQVPLLFPTYSSRWNIGTGVLPLGGVVSRIQDTTPSSPTGGFRREVPVAQLRFQ